MSKQTYINGFLNKCADSGVPSEIAGSLLTGAIPYVGSMANSVGGLAGIFSKGDKSRKGSAVENLIPGVGTYRLNNRLRTVADDENERSKKDKNLAVKPYHSLVAEQFGPLTSALLAGGLGAGIGAAADSGDRGRGGLVGGLTGLGVAGGAGLVALLAAAIRRRRTQNEQDSADSSVAAKWLLPGKAQYDTWKRLGRSRDLIKNDDKKNS